MTFAIFKGSCLLGANFIVPYGRLRFFASSQTICPCFHLALIGAFFCAVLLRVSIARVLLFHGFYACCSTNALFYLVSYSHVTVELLIMHSVGQPSKPMHY